MKPMLTMTPMRAMAPASKNDKHQLTEQIGVRVAPETLRALENFAQAERRKLSQLCRIALEEFVERRRRTA